ncbi:MAG: riboflavin biosynthesis protein RibF [Deltaproteobacteria bacterium]|nr:MAG: riboflavin biosynthesis protein RibF [Deltaproteobacteria bacterium]PIE73792.1 MAG: riboflavin biosynthesis protein RibF [Deltaproteobacteria bacterium]
MKIFRSIHMNDAGFSYPCVTIGNFDGVHRGHQRLFASVVEKARVHNGTSIVVTFDPHPLQVLLPEGIKLISSCEQKIELIEAAGIDVLILLPFSAEFAKTAAEEFVSDFLVGELGIQELVVGYDYAFGKGRRGDIPFLQQQGQVFGFPVTVIEGYHVAGQLVSSSRIRDLVRNGEMRNARQLLGRSYQIRGTVRFGRQRGGSLVGFPTANLLFNRDDLVPKHGVYVVEVLYSGTCYGGILNIGCNPTFGGQDLVAETHIFDFNRDIYDQSLRINLLQYLRGEQRFNSVADLSAQIEKDVVQAKKVLHDHALRCDDLQDGTRSAA